MACGNHKELIYSNLEASRVVCTSVATLLTLQGNFSISTSSLIPPMGSHRYESSFICGAYLPDDGSMSRYVGNPVQPNLISPAYDPERTLPTLPAHSTSFINDPSSLVGVQGIPRPTPSFSNTRTAAPTAGISAGQLLHGTIACPHESLAQPIRGEFCNVALVILPLFTDAAQT